MIGNESLTQAPLVTTKRKKKTLGNTVSCESLRHISSSNSISNLKSQTSGVSDRKTVKEKQKHVRMLDKWINKKSRKLIHFG